MRRGHLYTYSFLPCRSLYSLRWLLCMALPLNFPDFELVVPLWIANCSYPDRLDKNHSRRFGINHFPIKELFHGPTHSHVCIVAGGGGGQAIHPSIMSGRAIIIFRPQEEDGVRRELT